MECSFIKSVCSDSQNSFVCACPEVSLTCAIWQRYRVTTWYDLRRFWKLNPNRTKVPRAFVPGASAPDLWLNLSVHFSNLHAIPLGRSGPHREIYCSQNPDKNEGGHPCWPEPPTPSARFLIKSMHFELFHRSTRLVKRQQTLSLQAQMDQICQCGRWPGWTLCLWSGVPASCSQLK